MRKSVALVLAAVALVGLAGCKRSVQEANDGTPRVDLISFTPLPSLVLADQGARSDAAFVALACDGRNVLAVSTKGTIVDVFGVVSRIQHPPLSATTFAESSVVAVGRGGVIVRRDNGDTSWRPEGSPVAAALYGIAATPEWVVAVGAGGTIVARPNTKSPGPWTKIAAPTGEEDLFAVGRCDDAPVARICAVGAHGVLAVSDVMSSDLVFRAVPTGTTEALRAVARTSHGGAHAVGDRGTIVAIVGINAGGARARLVPSETTEDLAGVAGGEIARTKLEGSFYAVVAVGKHGTVLVQGTGRNKVSSFRTLRLPTTDDLVAIAMPDTRFLVAPRRAGVYTLQLDANARAPFPPE